MKGYRAVILVDEQNAVVALLDEKSAVRIVSDVVAVRDLARDVLHILDVLCSNIGIERMAIREIVTQPALSDHSITQRALRTMQAVINYTQSVLES